MNGKILVVEDEPKVLNFIKKGLEENNFNVITAKDGLTAKKIALKDRFDAIIFDVNLPGINGFQASAELRKHNVQVPILMLTALGTIDNKVKGFDSGADDYLVKPFDFVELLARLKSLVKRSQLSATGTILRADDLELHVEDKVVKRGNKTIDLTTKEFMLLEYLLRNKGKVISRADIARKIWDIAFDSNTNVIDVYVNFLRKKIDKDFKNKLIKTQIGMGYIIKDEIR